MIGDGRGWWRTAGDDGGRQAMAEKSVKRRKTAEDGGRRRGTTGDDGDDTISSILAPEFCLSGKFRKRQDGTTEGSLSSSLISTCRATLENDRTGRQAAVRPRPGSGRTDCPLANTAHYKIIHHACALLGHTMKEIEEGPESPEGEREKDELVKAIDQLNRIINKQECGVADDASLVNTLEPPTSNDPKLEKTAIETHIDLLELKIDQLLSRNSTETKKHASYGSIAQGVSSSLSALYGPEVQLEKHQAIDHTTRFVVEVSQPVPTAFNALDL